jgi:hypothetical protein
VLAELERLVGRFLNLQESLLSVTGDRSEETERAFLTFLNSISDIEATVDELKHSSSEISNLSDLMKNLRKAVSEFRVKNEASSSQPGDEDPDEFEPLEEFGEAGDAGEPISFDSPENARVDTLQPPDLPAFEEPPLNAPGAGQPGNHSATDLRAPLEFPAEVSNDSFLEVPADPSAGSEGPIVEADIEIAELVDLGENPEADGYYDAEGVEISQYYETSAILAKKEEEANPLVNRS